MVKDKNKLKECLLAKSSADTEAFTCYYSLQKAPFISAVKKFAIERIESCGSVTVGEIISLSREYSMPTSVWPLLFLKHLFHLGWGELIDENTLTNPVIKQT